EHFSDSWADIASVEVTNDATNVTFKINLNPLMNDGVTANNIQTNNFTKYDIGIHTGPGGSTALAVDYSQIFGLSTGMNYWVRSWANQGVNLGGYQAFAWNGSNFNTASPVATSSTVPIDPTATTLTIPLAALGLTNGSSFNFDVWSTFDNPAGQGAYDALARPTITPGAPFSDPNTPGSPTPYDGASGANYATTFYTVVIPVSASTWNVNGDGNWSNAANWQGGVPNAVGAGAVFGTISNAPHTVTVDGPQTVGTITFDNTNAYTIGGANTVTLDVSAGSAGINVLNGSHTISAPLTLNKNTTFTVTPATSTLSVTGAMNASTVSITKAGAGTVVFANVRAAGLSIGAGTVAIQTNGGDTGTSRAGTLSIAGGATPTATLDLRNNDLIVTSGTYAAITNAITFARNAGAWNRPGLTSSAAGAANPKNKTLGTLTGTEFHAAQGAGALFDGFTIANTDILVKFTYYGDVDFNGVVDFDDYSRIDAGFNNNRTGWFNGDVDYNGIVDFDDYSLIDQAFNTQSGTLRRAMAYLDGSDRSDVGMDAPSLQLVAYHLQQFGEQYAAGFLNSVPEPTSALALSGLAALAASRRRRRRN
ncbi:MAG: PEP-CTERM sorting domain-containing protein, partial [Anaerolineae bacterium]|nr:PEP-CTERM sorting domain-containing protein [Phycisphaerae bacterium]